jgi:hypothetical protein
VLSDEEKRELKEMAASDSLRAEFRVLRRNSQELAQSIGVDELARWLTAINRICPGVLTRRKFVNDSNFRL